MELPKRKALRLKNYDYSAPGAYFVTICTHGKACILSEIVGAIHESPENKLTLCGKYVDEVIGGLSERFDIKIEKYVIMPNHVHLLISIKGNDKRAIRESPLLRERSILSNVVGYLKMNASKKIRRKDGKVIWQRGYHDHIIRNTADYEKIWNYIDTNPLRWELDCFYNAESTVE